VTEVAEANPRGEFVLYHARAARRARNNLALDFAKTLGKRVVMAEWLDEPHLSPRIESFLRDASQRTAKEADVEYLFDPPREILQRAKFIVTDEFPTLPTPPTPRISSITTACCPCAPWARSSTRRSSSATSSSSSSNSSGPRPPARLSGTHPMNCATPAFPRGSTTATSASTKS
jgi:hypothetical protein